MGKFLLMSWINSKSMNMRKDPEKRMDNFKTMDDCELVSRLLANDQQAWEYVLLTVVCNFTFNERNHCINKRR